MSKIQEEPDGSRRVNGYPVITYAIVVANVTWQFMVGNDNNSNYPATKRILAPARVAPLI